LVKIRRRLAKKKYLDGKYTYAYERFYIEIPKKYQDRVRWLLDKDLRMDIKKVNGKLLIVLSPSNRFCMQKRPLSRKDLLKISNAQF